MGSLDWLSTAFVEQWAPAGACAMVEAHVEFP